MTETPRKVLIVSFDFPPRRTSAVYRMTGLTRALPQLGWQPTVLTIRHRTGVEEPSLLQKLPKGIRVVRTHYVDFMRWEDTLAKWMSRSTGKPNGRNGFADNGHRSESSGYLHRGAAFIRSTLYFPDHTIGWVPFGVRHALRLYREKQWDLIYTTSPPRAAPVIGWLLKELCGVPWVLEFMDPWYPPPGRVRRRAENKAHALLLRKADRVVVMTEGHGEELAQTFRLPQEKLKIVRNGFFEEDFAFPDTDGEPAFDPAYLHFCHFGTIYPGNDGLFFSALAELLRENPAWRSRLRVHLIGAASEPAVQQARQDGLADILQVHGFVSERTRILQMMRDSHCLLLFWGRSDFSRLAIAGKTYDYLRAGRPILAVTCEGGVQQLIQGGSTGWVARPDDVGAIKQALCAAIEGRNGTNPDRAARSEFVAQFRWERQAEILARAFNEAADHAG